MIFEWDARKALANLKKHGVSFDEAVGVFLDPLAITFADPDHSVEEIREITIGYTMRGSLVIVSHSARRGNLRIIGARRATRNERKEFEEIGN